MGSVDARRRDSNPSVGKGDVSHKRGGDATEPLRADGGTCRRSAAARTLKVMDRRLPLAYGGGSFPPQGKFSPFLTLSDVHFSPKRVHFPSSRMQLSPTTASTAASIICGFIV